MKTARDILAAVGLAAIIGAWILFCLWAGWVGGIGPS